MVVKIPSCSVNIVYDTSQEIVTGSTTQNFLQQGIDSAEVDGVSDSIDTINGFNMEDNGPGAEDIFDLTAFIQDDNSPANGDDIAYGDWTGGITNVDGNSTGGFVREIAVIRVNENFGELDASHFVEQASGTLPGIEVFDNGSRVVVKAYDSDEDDSVDKADIYFVQDLDQDTTGQAWAVDKVATVDFATEIGAIQTIDIDNFVI